MFETVLEINLNKLEQNVAFLRSTLSPKTKFLAVVKAFAYGHGAEDIALKLQTLLVDYFAVAYTHEGVALRKAGIKKPIIVLHPQPSNFKTLIDNCLEPSIYSFSILKTFIAIADSQNQQQYPVHLKFNTGLNRLGFVAHDVAHVAEITNTSNAIRVSSVFSHLAASDDLKEDDFTQKQIATFTAIKDRFKQLSTDQPFAHLTNTSGTLNYPEAHFDMVRIGIGLYGFGNDVRFKNNLQPIAALKSVISQIHELKKDDSVGYNRAFIASQKMLTATIPLGHADGISRQFGNGNGHVIVQGKKAKIIGNVCMDMIMIDVSHLSCKEGDEVVVFDGNYTVDDFASDGKTISYEVLTAISDRIKKVYI